MFLDARSLPENHLIETDICIIGAGVAGITLARELIGQSYRVCVLESGSFDAEMATQSLADGEATGHPYYPLNTARVRQFSGSSIKWLLELGQDQLGARLLPLDESDFEKRDWVPYSGWPFTKAHLDPYYERAQKVCKVGPYTYQRVEDWENPTKTPRLPVAADRLSTNIYQFVRRDVFGRDYRDELTSAENITVYLHTNVLDLNTSSDGNVVTDARAACLDGKEFSIRAKQFIVAVGGIETPRLLLLSNKTQTAGLGNQNDLVGRFFMEHPHLWSGNFVPADKGLFNKTGLYEMHWVNGTPVVGQIMINEALRRQEKMLNYSLVLKPALRRRKIHTQRALGKGMGSIKAAASALRYGDVSEFNRHLSTLFPVTGELSIAAYRRAMRVLNKLLKVNDFDIFQLNHMSEQVPNPNSRVTLTQDRDRLGQNRALLDWQLTSLDIWNIRHAQEIVDEEFRRAGLGHLEIELEDDTPPPHLHGGWHHMGTTRMHVDPKKGVVDADQKVHGVSNLYIAGPSVFPTGGCANPVLTIVALTVRLADHLKTVMR